MRKTFKYRIYPTKAMEKKLFFVLNRCRELYNAALSERRDAYKYAKKSVTYNQQANDLPEIKHEIRPEYEEIASHVLQDVLKRLDKAFQNFFRRIKEGQTPGYPRFQGRNRYDSFTYPDIAGWKLPESERPLLEKKARNVKLTLSKMGSITLRLHRPLEGTIKTVTIKREVDHWFVCFSCELVELEKLPVSYEEVGIDLGVSHLATLSNGEMIEHPRYYRKAKKTLEQRQQALSRKKRGSHRRDRARKLVARAHRKVRNQRQDYHHKASRSLVNRYQLLVFEDIQTINLVRKPKSKQDAETGQYLPNGAAAKGGLNKSILDAGWGSFVAMCSYKAACASRILIKVDPKYTSQICSRCGTGRKKTLEERWHSCDCGAELDRDVNAAVNILVRGKQQLLAWNVPTSAMA